jgi:carbon-monoxide dehydrogenase large subunit
MSAATTTVMNAIFDALVPLGVSDLPMPATPERVWQAIHRARPLRANRS